MEEAEVKFWELTKDDSRTKDDELDEVLLMLVIIGKKNDEIPLFAFVGQISQSVFHHK